MQCRCDYRKNEKRKMSEKELSYRKRKPNLETESLRVWDVKDNEKEEIKGLKEKYPIIVKQGDMELHLTGFAKAIDKKTDKVIFAYKFKHKDRMILYYISEKLSKENQKKVEKYFIRVNQICIPIDYQLKDVRKMLKNIELNKKMLMEVFKK